MTYWKQSLLLNFIFFYEVFLLPPILYLIRQMFHTDDSFIWSPSHQFFPHHSFLKRCLPGPTGWPAALGKWAFGAERSGYLRLGRAQECILESTLPCRSPWLQPRPACPARPLWVPWRGGCTRSHDPVCGAWSVQEQKLGRSLTGLEQALCKTQRC